ncbi:unnamed protein product [Ostreobium quekettii]|uniref:VHS domain-containing protein n=1 Tax=Ostreobium quekettii TaxID=121088 RepID=A0A8S1J882_9CHLO|nr:unnamed protein product [Ostreobium quekettii]|eukprot:evm.model.scf_2256.1 EVM.evm.TU.scf_2256.1   scf_2256:11680-17984(-)
MSRVDKERDALLLPALDKAAGGVQWSSVARLMNMVREANSISKHLRYSLKARLTCGEEPRVLNTLTVLHTISLNGSLEVRKQLSDTKHLKLLEKVYMSFSTGLAAAAVCQMLVDWTFMFSNEELGQKSARLMKHLRSKGAPALRATQIATERREEIMLGVPILRFVHGMDFGTPHSQPAADVHTGGSHGSQTGGGDAAPTKESKLSKLKRLFSRAPSTPAPKTQVTPSLQQPRNNRWGNKQKDKTPAWVDEMLNRMPVDASDLMEIVGSIRTLKENGGSEADVSGMMVATEPLAKKVTTWHDWAQELVASQMDSIAADMMTGTRQASSKHANITLESSKLTRLLEANDEVQRVVVAWKRLQQEVAGQPIQANLDPIRTGGPQNFVRRSSSVAAPNSYREKVPDGSPNSFSAVETMHRRLEVANNITPRMPDIPTGGELCYDLQSGDCGDVGVTPKPVCADRSPLGDCYAGVTPFRVDLDTPTLAEAEESYMPEGEKRSRFRDASQLDSSVARPGSEWRTVEENVREMSSKATKSFPRSSEGQMTAQANIRGGSDGFHSFSEPQSQSPTLSGRRPAQEGHARMSNYATASASVDQRRSEGAHKNRENNPFCRSSATECLHDGYDHSDGVQSEVVQPVQGVVTPVVSPFQRSSMSNMNPPMVPIEVKRRRSLQPAEKPTTTQRRTSTAVEPSLAVRAVMDNWNDPTRLCELSSSYAGISLEDPKPVNLSDGRDDDVIARVGLSSVASRRPVPDARGREQESVARASRKAEARVHPRSTRASRSAGRHEQHTSLASKYRRHPFGNLAAESQGSPDVKDEAQARTPAPRAPGRPQHPPKEQSMASRRKQGTRTDDRKRHTQQSHRAHKGTPRAKARSGRHSVPLSPDRKVLSVLENKMLLRSGAAPPKIVRASLDALREQRGHRIPALRVRFTQEHLRDVLHKMSEKPGRKLALSERGPR